MACWSLDPELVDIHLDRGCSVSPPIFSNRLPPLGHTLDARLVAKLNKKCDNLNTCFNNNLIGGSFIL